MSHFKMRFSHYALQRFKLFDEQKGTFDLALSLAREEAPNEFPCHSVSIDGDTITVTLSYS